MKNFSGTVKGIRYDFVVESDLIFLDVMIILWLCDFRR